MKTESDLNSDTLDVENRIIYLNEKDDTVETPGVDYRMAQTFIKNINSLQNISDDPIIIYMQTVGGCWYSGMGIYDAIKLSKCKVTMIGYSLLCSMGSIIMQSADRRILMPNCAFMCHYGTTNASGDFLSAHNYARFDKINMQTMIDIYAAKCQNGEFFKERGDSLSKIKSYIKRKLKDGDWYMAAEEAVHYGFADTIMSRSLKI
jgi:ATP-dependent Clp protease protease subunit